MSNVQIVLQAKQKLVNHAAEFFHYDFSGYYYKKIYNKIIEETPKLDLLDFNIKSIEKLGLSLYDDIYLIPLWLVPFINPNLKVTCFVNNEVKKLKDCDLDNRFGYIAYGILIKK